MAQLATPNLRAHSFGNFNLSSTVCWLLLLFAATATGFFPASGTLSLAGQRQPLQLRQIHPCQPHSRLKVFGVALNQLRIAGSLGI